MSKDITVEQFKSWLEGVEDMQGSDWVPDKTQWKKIRNKIKLITTAVPAQSSQMILDNTAPSPHFPSPPAYVQTAGSLMHFDEQFPMGNALDSIPIGQTPVDGLDVPDDGPYKSPFK